MTLLASAVFFLGCDSGKTDAPAAQEDSPVDVSGLWTVEGTDMLVGLSIRVTPGVSPDVDPWKLDLGGEKFTCTPSRSESGWQLESCSGLPPEILDFAVLVPARPEEPMSLNFMIEGEAITASLRRVPPNSDPDQSKGVELLWQRRPSFRCQRNLGLWATDGLVYGPCATGVVEILDGESGRLVGTTTLAGTRGEGLTAALEVVAQNNRLYVATTSRGLLVYDLTEPSRPRLAGQFIQPGPEDSPNTAVNFHNLTLSPDGRWLFLINQSFPATDMLVLDVTNGSAPKQVGRYAISDTTHIFNGAHDVYLTERGGRLYAYLNRLRSGLDILDVTDPANIIRVGSFYLPEIFSHSGWFFERAGHSYFAHTDEGSDKGLTVLNVDDIASPQVVSIFKTRRGISIHNIRVVDGLAYIAYYVDGLRIVDLRDPIKPREVAHYDTVSAQEERAIFDGAWGIHLDGGRIFISDMSTGIYAFRLAAPLN